MKHHRDSAFPAGQGYYRSYGDRGSFTYGEWYALCKAYGSACLACGSDGRLTPDHIVPLSRGGSNTIDNIQPLCWPCNLLKMTKTIDYRVDKEPHAVSEIPEWIDDGMEMLKIEYATWQRLTQLSALTGEPRTKLVERLVNEELKRKDYSKDY